MSQLSADRVRRIATKGFTVAAMAVIALVAVSTSLPAAALLSASDVQAAALQEQVQAQEATVPESVEESQSVSQANGSENFTIERDGFESQTVAEVAAASGIRLEATFTNNPNGTVQWPFPVGVHIGSKFGYRDCAGCSADHQGLDFNPGVGAPIQSIADGVVTVASEGGNSLGVYMVIEHQINGETVSSAYAHMISGSMLFNVGDTVKVGDIIGKVGDTGMSTGPHLHFEIRLGGVDAARTDPLPWLYANTN
jgi:murein DD-endopeptidase MepM/ murein hydrolase activator NlpD